VEKVRRADFRVVYSGKDVTEDVAPAVVEINYTDNLTADDLLEITVENKDGRWLNSWFPEDGDEIEVWVGWENLYPLGKFTVRKVRFQPRNFTATITAVSHNLKKSIRRTKKNRSFEKTNLKKIVEQIASENQLQPVVEVPDVPIERVDQFDQTDAQFLKSLSEKFGCIFKVAGDRLVFVEESYLEGKDSPFVITPDSIIDIELSSDAGKIYRACEVRYYDPKEGKEKVYTYTLPERVGEVLKTRERVENLQQAITLARSLLRRKNRRKRTLRAVIPGAPLFAGMTFTLSGYGQMDGKYIVDIALHRVSGYWETEIEARRCLNY